MRQESRAYAIFSVFNYIFLFLIALVCLYPFYYVVIASFSNPDRLIVNQGILLLPLQDYTLRGYQLVFHNRLILSGFCNTLVILFAGLFFNLVLTSLGGYVLSLRDLMLRKPLSIIIIITLYFSGGMIPAYLNIRDLGMMDSLWALIIPGAISTHNMLIMRSAFMAVPESLPEAAKIDGGTHLHILFRVMAPLVKATTAVMVLYYGVGHWNSWFGASLYLRTSSKYPLQLVLRNVLIENQVNDMMLDVGADESPQITQLVKYAMIVVSTVPIICIYPFLQRFFQKGVMLGAVKG